MQINVATVGGECNYGFTLYNFLRTLPVPMHTHDLGTVESMGSIPSPASERHNAGARSKFLFHSFHWTLHGAADRARMAEYVMSLDYDLELYARVVAENVRDTPERLDIPSYLMVYSRILGPEDVLAYGLIHTVDDSPIPASVCQRSIHS